MGAQASVLAISLCALVLASLFAERRHHEAALFEGQAQLQEALTAGGVMAFEWNARTNASNRSDNAAQILGLDPNKPFSAAGFLERVHPDDRADFKSAYPCCQSGQTFIQEDISFPVSRRSGNLA